MKSLPYEKVSHMKRIPYEKQKTSLVQGDEGMVANKNVVLNLFLHLSKLYLWESKIFLSSKMMNYQPQHIQKREIVEIQKIK